MNTTQIRILELFETLDQQQRVDVAEQLRERSRRGRFYDQMTSEQRAELHAGLAEADRDEGAEEAEVFGRLGQKLGLQLT